MDRVISICKVCRESDVHAKGRCARCAAYWRRTGRERPTDRLLLFARGENHCAWKGDDASTTTKRERAQRMYSLGSCDECGKAAHDRHHRDSDTGNNAPENIGKLCRRCHMAEDGRLEAFRKLARSNAEKMRKPPRKCRICPRMTTVIRKGRCHTCAMYYRRRGVERPSILHRARA